MASALNEFLELHTADTPHHVHRSTFHAVEQQIMLQEPDSPITSLLDQIYDTPCDLCWIMMQLQSQDLLHYQLLEAFAGNDTPLSSSQLASGVRVVVILTDIIEVKVVELKAQLNEVPLNLP